MNALTRYTTTTLLFLILFVPLIFDKTGFYGYVVPKGLIFQTSVIFCAIVYLFSIKTPPVLRYNYLSLSVSLFCLITLLLNILSYDNLFSIGATFERMEGAINTILLCLLFFLVMVLLNNETKQRNAFIIMLAVAFGVAIFGILSAEKVAGRLISSIGNPAFLCFYLANHLFLIAIFYLKYKPRFSWLLLILLILFLWVSIQTLTRTFYIAFIFSGILMVVLYIFNLTKKENRTKVLIISTLSFFSILILLYFLGQNSWVINNLPIGRLTNTSTLDARFLVWEIAFQGFKDRWFWGWGQENFSYVYSKFFNTLLVDEGVWYDRAHNVFLDWFVAGGLIGGLTHIAIWTSAIFCIWRASFKNLIKILLTGWVAFYCCFIFFNPDSLINSIFAIIILAYISLNSPTKKVLTPILYNHFSIIILFSIGVLVTIFYQFTYQNIRSYQVFSKAIAEPSIENLIELSNKAYTIRSAVNLNMIEQLTFMHRTVISSQLSPQQKQTYTESLQKLIEKELKRHPPSVKLLELKSMLELNINDISTANKTLDKIIELSPNYALAYMQKGKAALAQNRLDDAIANFNKISEIAPRYIPAKLFKMYVNALKEPKYEIETALKQIPQMDIANNIKLVREIFDGLGKPKGFVDWIWNGNLMGIYMPKPVYFEWITTAFKIGDLERIEKMLTIYRDNYYCDTSLAKKILSDAQQGIPPDQSLKELLLSSPK